MNDQLPIPLDFTVIERLTTIRRILCEQFNVKRADDIALTTTLESFGMDSLDSVELVMAFEDEYNIEVSDEEVEKIRTVGDILTCLNNVLSRTKPRGQNTPSPILDDYGFSDDSIVPELPSPARNEPLLVRTHPPALLPCPFCGAPPQWHPRLQGPEHHGPDAYWPEAVECSGCRILFRRDENGVTDPVNKWNERRA